MSGWEVEEEGQLAQLSFPHRGGVDVIGVAAGVNQNHRPNVSSSQFLIEGRDLHHDVDTI